MAILIKFLVRSLPIVIAKRSRIIFCKLRNPPTKTNFEQNLRLCTVLSKLIYCTSGSLRNRSVLSRIRDSYVWRKVVLGAIFLEIKARLESSSPDRWRQCVFLTGIGRAMTPRPVHWPFLTVQLFTLMLARASFAMHFRSLHNKASDRKTCDDDIWIGRV